MEVPFEPVADVAALDALLGQSAATPVVLFNHDRSCPISRHVARALGSLAGPIAVIDVTRQHDLTRAVAARTGVAHESPQVLVVREGRAAWSAAHFAITADAVAHAVQEAGGAQRGEATPRRPAGLWERLRRALRDK